MAVCVCVCVLCHVCVCLCGGIFHPSGGMNAQKRRKKTPRSLLMDIGAQEKLATSKNAKIILSSDATSDVFIA